MKKMYDRRKFIKNSAYAGLGLGLATQVYPFNNSDELLTDKKIGIIGLDTSHAVAFTKEINNEKPDYAEGYKVTAAYPKGSLDIKSSVERVDEYTTEVKEMGVDIVSDIPELLEGVDVVLLETNDGRRHLEQIIPVLKAQKPVFIDKPVAASLVDALIIYKLADHYEVPIFSSSSLRYMESAQNVRNGEIGAVLGADAFSPSIFEETHPDFFWYGIHGVEILYTVMGTGCKELTRTYTKDTDLTVGVWEDGRIGSFRGTRTGKHTYGGTAYGEEGDEILGPFEGYNPLLKEIIAFFDSGKMPIDPKETLEIFTFMEAADESRLSGGGKVNLQEIKNRAIRKADKHIADLI